jgi:hypothetical protein
MQMQRSYWHYVNVCDVPSRTCVMNVVQKFEEAGSVWGNVKGLVRHKWTVRTDETMQCMKEVQGS